MTNTTSAKATALLAALKEKGHRTTKTRSLVISYLVQTEHPVAAHDLITMLKKQGRDVNKTTVYRELLFLKDEGIINEIDLLEGQKRYELADPHHHHHHLVCTKCKSIRCVEMPNDLDALEQRIKKQHHFHVTGHILEFFGLCKKCTR
jgi:Fe2+ or Zn2+ uptake regulation protein